jgi:hypothetical protein
LRVSPTLGSAYCNVVYNVLNASNIIIFNICL